MAGFEAQSGVHASVTVPAAEMAGTRRGLAACRAESIEAEGPTPFRHFSFRTPDGHVFGALPGGPARVRSTDLVTLGRRAEPSDDARRI